MSITIGAMAITRLSTAAVVQVVQPRLDPPATMNESIFTLPASGPAQNAITVSMARTALLVMGSRAGHRSSPVRRNLSHVNAIKASSERVLLSPAKING